eukprot:CAMPEP_0181187990 /NCGR_PEP_ID=MMETSP1096-20121128/10869_1 /TAXON_ID=156174 ORGANISM="Chrysochromulina ericina, Strain CCMP281" /NCGR_SAMPLE_ID=MMETSP1096 /ASSEMBLY_ACC=CAM_ASM_000453 /LENGTH=86 /DNA_ID=CAMNT_0023277005 /DNA_START=258 /DNA_END=519 /DNA_ORIENTATION=-
MRWPPPSWQQATWQRGDLQVTHRRVGVAPLEETGAAHGSPYQAAQNALEMLGERLEEDHEAAEAGGVAHIVEGKPFKGRVDDDREP